MTTNLDIAKLTQYYGVNINSKKRIKNQLIKKLPIQIICVLRWYPQYYFYNNFRTGLYFQ